MSKKSFKVKNSIVLEPQQTPPSGPESGEIYNDETKGLQQWDNANSSWQDIGSSSSSGIQYLPNPSAERNTNGWNLYTDFLNCPIADDTTEYVGIKKTSASTLASLGDIRAQQRMQYVGTNPFGGLTLNNSYYISSPALQIGYYGVQLADTLGGTTKNITSNAGANLSGFRPYVPLQGETGNWGATSLTLTRNTTSPLAGEADFKLSKPASNCLGEGVSTDFKIDKAYCGSILSINYLYSITGTYSTGDVTVWVYDKTNNKIIQPTAYQVVATGVAGPAQSLTFQTSIDSVDYRLIFHVSSTSASAYEMNFTNVFLRPQVVPVGSARPPVGTVLSFAGSALPEGFLWCNGAAIGRTQYADLFAAIGTAHGSGDGSTTFNLPDYRGRFLRGRANGSANDPDRASRTAMNTGGATGDNVGSVQGHQLAAHTHNIPYTTVGQGGSGSAMQYGGAGAGSGSTGGNETRPVNAYVNYIICYNSGNVVVSDSAASRAVTATMIKTGGAISASVALTNWTTVADDSHGGINLTNGSYTVKVPGSYQFTGSVETSGATSLLFGPAINGTNVGVYSVDTVSTIYKTIHCQLPNLKAGDVITFKNGGSGTGTNTSSRFSISLIQGPAQISAGTVVACSYENPTGVGFGIAETVKFTTKIVDTHGAYNPATGMFTAPVSGIYEISSFILSNIFALATTSALRTTPQKNSAGTLENGWITGTGGNISYAVHGVPRLFSLNVGDTLSLKSEGTSSIPYSKGSLSIKLLSGVN